MVERCFPVIVSPPPTCYAPLPLIAVRVCFAAEANQRDQGLLAHGAEEGRQMCAAALAQGLTPGCLLKQNGSRCLAVRLWDSELPCQTWGVHWLHVLVCPLRSC